MLYSSKYSPLENLSYETLFSIKAVRMRLGRERLSLFSHKHTGYISATLLSVNIAALLHAMQECATINKLAT